MWSGDVVIIILAFGGICFPKIAQRNGRPRQQEVPRSTSLDEPNRIKSVGGWKRQVIFLFFSAPGPALGFFTGAVSYLFVFCGRCAAGAAPANLGLLVFCKTWGWEYFRLNLWLRILTSYLKKFWYFLKNQSERQSWTIGTPPEQ